MGQQVTDSGFRERPADLRIRWCAGWYATRLHAISEEQLEVTKHSGDQGYAFCGAKVSSVVRTAWAQKRIDKGIPRCKHCERILAQRGIDSSKNIHQFSMQLRLEREDMLPAFAAFLKCEEQKDDSHVVLVNVQALMVPEVETAARISVGMSRNDRKRNLIACLMHEFGHALEEHFNLPENERAIAKVCEEWEMSYIKIREVGEGD